MVAIARADVCKTCGDTGWACFKPEGCRPEWFECEECRVCSDCERRHLIDDDCDCEGTMNDTPAGYRDFLQQQIEELDAEIANKVGLTDEARAKLELARDGYLMLLEKEECGRAID